MIEMHIVANLVTLGVIGALAYIGWSNGLFFSVLLLLRMVISIVLTMICFEELAMLLEKVSVPHPWAIFSAFAGLFLVALFLSTAILDAALKEKQFHTFEMIDQAGGAVGGAIAGLVFMGGVLVAWTMCPLPTQYRLDPGSIAIDAGKLAIQAVPGFSKRVVLESPARAEQETHASETATEIEFFGSEPFVDANGNGQWDEGESFVDIDRSGGFTKILVVNAHVKDGQAWNPGLLRRYAAGHWDHVPVTLRPKKVSTENTNTNEQSPPLLPTTLPTSPQAPTPENQKPPETTVP